MGGARDEVVGGTKSKPVSTSISELTHRHLYSIYKYGTKIHYLSAIFSVSKPNGLLFHEFLVFETLWLFVAETTLLVLLVLRVCSLKEVNL